MPSDSGNPPVSVPPKPQIELEVYPWDLRSEREQWITWKEDDKRKIPRAPYAHPEWPDKYVDAQDADLWTDFETAREWAETLSGHGLAYVIGDREHYREDLVLVDYDDVRDSDSGAIHPVVRGHLQQAASYADVSTSGTGIHLLCRGSLPAAVTAVEADLPTHPDYPNAEIEVYDSARFVVMTGAHIVATPTETRTAIDFLAHLVDQYGNTESPSPSGQVSETMEEAIEGVGTVNRGEGDPSAATTSDIQDVFRAIEQIEPSDIQLRSTATEERSDGTKSLDPAWENSKSGTRIAQLEDGWLYRQGMQPLNALQIVALEEGLITSVEEYPEGETFWEAVETLRNRGAHIPELVDE